MSPFNAFMFIQGLETLPIRMRAHCENANAVAEYLVGHEKVTKVISPKSYFRRGESRADAHLNGSQRRLSRF